MTITEDQGPWGVTHGCAPGKQPLLGPPKGGPCSVGVQAFQVNVHHYCREVPGSLQNKPIFHDPSCSVTAPHFVMNAKKSEIFFFFLVTTTRALL